MFWTSLSREGSLQRETTCTCHLSSRLPLRKRLNNSDSQGPVPKSPSRLSGELLLKMTSVALAYVDGWPRMSAHVRELTYTVFFQTSQRELAWINMTVDWFSFSSLQFCQCMLSPLESRSKTASFSARPGVLVAGIVQFLSLHLFYLVIPPLLGIPTTWPKLVKGSKTTLQLGTFI